MPNIWEINTYFHWLIVISNKSLFLYINMSDKKWPFTWKVVKLRRLLMVLRLSGVFIYIWLLSENNRFPSVWNALVPIPPLGFDCSSLDSQSVFSCSGTVRRTVCCQHCSTAWVAREDWQRHPKRYRSLALYAVSSADTNFTTLDSPFAEKWAPDTVRPKLGKPVNYAWCYFITS